MLPKLLALGCFALLGVGCAMNESVDDDQNAVGAAGAGGSDLMNGTGGVGPGGAAGAPGTPAATGGAAGSASGGAAGAGGEATGGAAGAPPVCGENQKLCDTGCVDKTPETGCGSVGCAPCGKPPANSKGVCEGALCEFECLPGFERQGFACVSDAGGGAGGASGSGGSGGSGGLGSGSGGSGGGLQVCVAPCNPSEASSQLLCAAACISKGGMGLCAPALNCCVCG